MDARVALTGLLILTATACGASSPRAPGRPVLDCLQASGWLRASDPRPNVVILEAADRHAEVELVFWRSEAAARRAVPDLAPIGVGWAHNVSWRSTDGFTYADEQWIDRCLLG